MFIRTLKPETEGKLTQLRKELSLRNTGQVIEFLVNEHYDKNGGVSND